MFCCGFIKLYKELSKKVNLKYFEDKHSIKIDEYHGETLEGPQINKIYKHIDDLLEEVCNQDELCVFYIDTIKRLKEVEKVANSKDLNTSFNDIIDNFVNSWKTLTLYFGTTVPNKVHLIQSHLPDFFREKGHSLYGLSDQVIESCHQEFSKRLSQSNYDVKNYRSFIHGKKLKRGVVHFNSFNFL